ncbi:MAG: RHS repeat domain-containing protein [Flavobacteriaceae bacterium]
MKSINQDQNDDNDLFNFGISYNTVSHGGTPLFNGNIAETEWTTANDPSTGSGQAQRWYRYGYDALNRIKSATAWDANKYSVSNITYDRNGNLLSLNRKGHIVEMPDIDVATNFGDMDKLVYGYFDNSNRLKSVTDSGNISYGFKDGNTVGNDYSYDANGNMLSDANKKITGIGYNHLNLPEKVTVTGAKAGTLDYVYDAVGTKLQRKKTKDGVTETTDYANGYIYENGSLVQFVHPEGYVEPQGDGYRYFYNYLDNLGTVRLVYSDYNNDGDIDVTNDPLTTEIVMERNTYPFGMQMRGFNTDVNGVENNYMTYNGKELDESLGLNWHDYGARNYDASIGRWMNMDPLSEKYYDFSTYTYTMNNPVLFADPDGMRVEWGNGLSAEEKELIGYLIYQLRKNSKTFDKAFTKLHNSKNTYTVSDNLISPDAEFRPNTGLSSPDEYDEELDIYEEGTYTEVNDFGGDIRIPLDWGDQFPSLEVDKTLKTKQTLVEEFVHAVQWETLFPSSGKTTLDLFLDISGIANTEFEAKTITGIIHDEVGWNVLTGGNSVAAESGLYYAKNGFSQTRYFGDAEKWLNHPKTNPGYKERPLMTNVLPTVLINVLKSKK